MFRAENWHFFDYPLPEEKIALRPVWHDHPERGGSKLLHFSFDGTNSHLSDLVFHNITDLLSPGDLLILNNTKVINARFIFSIGKREAELLLCRMADEESWYCLSRPMRHFSLGHTYRIAPSLLAEVIGVSEDKRYLNVRIYECDGSGEAKGIASIDVIHGQGVVPIPPYIRKGKSDHFDKTEYQTVYAEHFGSVAAPTAGLHFSNEILSSLKNRGVLLSYLTLHVGPASFLPVFDSAAHRPMTETYYVNQSLWEGILDTRKRKNKVIAVGTTVIRALESFAKIQNKESAFNKALETDLFISPGYTFDVVSSCVTNFHQPKSTHLLLIAALIGTENLEKVYRHALSHNYRFLSYGDSSFLDLS